MILEKIGEANMYDQLGEEAAELSIAAHKMARIIRNENPTPKTREEMSKEVKEEFSDLMNCVRELHIVADKDLMSQKMKRFVERWEKHIDEVT